MSMVISVMIPAPTRVCRLAVNCKASEARNDLRDDVCVNVRDDARARAKLKACSVQIPRGPVVNKPLSPEVVAPTV